MLAEHHEEWLVARRYLSAESLSKVINTIPGEAAPLPALVEAA